MKRGAKIACAAAAAMLLLGTGLFFANEANVFPRAAYPMRSFAKSDAEKIWGAGDYVCARVGGVSGLRCALRANRRSPVENAITISFLSNPVALVADAPHVCALERGEILCWDMGTPILRGLGLVYSPQQQRAGTIDHGTLPARAAVRMPMQGTVRALLSHAPGFCAIADDGISCFKFNDAKAPLPEKVWSTHGRTLVVGSGEFLCTEQGDALECFADPSRYTNGARPAGAQPLALKIRAEGVTGVTAIAASYGAFCALGDGRVACAKRVDRGSSPALEELKLVAVAGLGAPTELWASGFDVFVRDADRIVLLGERDGFAGKVWGRMEQGEELYVGAGDDWFLYRGGNLVRSPNHRWPIKYAIGGRPTQVIASGLETCALVGPRVMCFAY